MNFFFNFQEEDLGEDLRDEIEEIEQYLKGGKVLYSEKPMIEFLCFSFFFFL